MASMQASDSRPDPLDHWIALGLGLLALTTYLATTSLSFHSIDEFAVFGVARSLLGHGRPDVDVLYWTEAALGRGPVATRGLDGHTYALKDVGPSILILPLVWLGGHLGNSPIRAALLISPLVTALTSGLLYLTIISWGYRRNAAVVGGLVFAWGSLAWPYAESLFTQPLAALGLLIALHGVIRAHDLLSWPMAFLGGLGLGIAGLSTVPAWVTLPVYLLYLAPLKPSRVWRKALPNLMAFGVGAGLMACGQGAYNLLRFGSVLETGYQQAGVTDFHLLYMGTGIPGLLLSTSRGLIWYAPFVILVPPGLWMGWQTGQRVRLAVTAMQAGIVLLLYSSYAIWWGGLNWGPRFLVPLMPALTLLAMPTLSWLTDGRLSAGRIAVGLILLVSTVTQFLASIADIVPSDLPLVEALGQITPPTSFLTPNEALTRLNALPWPRLIGAIQAGLWDALALSQRPFDLVLLTAQVIAVLSATGLFAWLIRSSLPARARWGWIAGQGTLVVALTLLMLIRSPQKPHEVPGIDTLAAAVRERTQPGDGIIVLLPNGVLAWMDSYPGQTPDYGVMLESPLSEETADYLADITAWHNRIWLVTEGATTGHPADGVARWLANHAFIGPGIWVEQYRVTPYTFSAQEREYYVGQLFGDGEIALDYASIEVIERESLARWINVRLRWRALAAVGRDYTAFVQLLDRDGTLVAQHDGVPLAGYAPTSTWQPGRTVNDRHSVPLRSDLPPGEYQLVVGLYDPATGQRLPLTDGSGDALAIRTIPLNK